MTQLDPGILKPWLDEYEKYAAAIKSGDLRFDIAQKMLGIIAMARESLHPSADSTANYVHHKDIIEELATLQANSRALVKD